MTVSMDVKRHLPGFLTGSLAGAVAMLLTVPLTRTPEREPSMAQPSSAPASLTDALERERPRPHPAPDASKLPERLDDLRHSNQPYLRAAQLTQLGYEAAGQDPNLAITQLDAIADRPGKHAYLKGLFTRIAEDKPPYEAIQRVKRLSRDLEVEGFKTLISQWTGTELSEHLAFGDIYRRLLTHEDVSPKVKRAWLQSYQNHSHLGAMTVAWAGALIQDSPSEALAMGENFTGWQRQEFYGNLVEDWILADSEAAWQWLADHPQEVRPEAMASALERWAMTDLEAAQDGFARLTEPESRVAASAALAGHLATSQGTRASLDWADSLPTTAEQDAAHEAIYVATPRGIGAALSMDEGAMTIQSVLPHTPASAAGLQSGDRIIQVDAGNGAFQSLSPDDQGLEQAINLIRGEAGTPLRLRVIRLDGQAAVIELNRQQLVFE